MDMNTQQFLTRKQQCFCDEYLKDMNATRAALRAGYSNATALNGSLMQMPKIKLYMQQHLETTSATAGIDRNRVLTELGKIAFANVADYFLPDGKLKPMQDFTADESAAVHSITVSKDGAVTIGMNNKLAALEKIARLLNLYKPEHKKQERVYVYLDREDMTEDDTFDDDELEREMEEAREDEELNRNHEELDDEEGNEILHDNTDTMPLNTNSSILRDGAGIPYAKPNPDNFLDLSLTPAEFLAKLNGTPVPAAEIKKPLPLRDDPDRNYGFPPIFKVTRR